MSRANPVSLRIASHTLNSPFIGVGEYYFYNQLKEQISITKATQQLSKQIVLPTKQLGKYKAFSAERFLVLTPGRLPVNTVFIAKQLFSTQYTLNKRRFFSTTIYYTRWLQKKFDHNYNFLAGSLSSASITFPQYNNDRGNGKKERTLLLPPKEQKRKGVSMRKKGQSFPRKSKLGYSTKYLFTDKITNCRLADLRDKDQQVNILYKYFTPCELKKNTSLIVKQSKLTDSLNKGLRSLYFKNLEKTQKENFQKKKNGLLPSPPSLYKGKTAKTILKNICKQFCFRPDNKQSAYNLFFLMCLVKLHQNIKGYSSSTSFLLKEEISPSFFQRKKEPQGGVKDSFLLPSLFHKEVGGEDGTLQKNSITNQLSNSLRKPVFLKKTPRQFSTSSLENIDQIPGYDKHRSPFYVLSPNSLKKSNGFHYDKIQKYIYDFRDTSKLLMELRLVIHRSFCQPTGVNYISGLENRLSKSTFIPFTNALFFRIIDNYPRPNFINSQIGLTRLKTPVFFEFLYNQKIRKDEHSSLKENKYYKTLPSHQALWLRKGSSIRL